MVLQKDRTQLEANLRRQLPVHLANTLISFERVILSENGTKSLGKKDLSSLAFDAESTAPQQDITSWW